MSKLLKLLLYRCVPGSEWAECSGELSFVLIITRFYVDHPVPGKLLRGVGTCEWQGVTEDILWATATA